VTVLAAAATAQGALAASAAKGAPSPILYRVPDTLDDVEIEVGGWRRPAAVGFMPDLAPNGHGLLGQSGFFDLFSFVKFERPKGTIELGAVL
jgi:hypothetical protein